MNHHCWNQEWLLEEYKLLSQHYFHEDKTLMDAIRSYLLINSGLLAFFSSIYFQTNRTFESLIPLVGIILCFSWVSTLTRQREWRQYISSRIKEIEMDLQGIWELNNSMPKVYVLDIRSMRNWDNKTFLGEQNQLPWFLKFFRNVPSSYSLIAVPIIFLISWIVMLFYTF